VGNNAGLYALTEEHDAIRAAVREIAEREIAPYAAEVDAESRYPVEAQKALTAAGFHATHIPEQYGGEGADAIATCIVIEEVARVDVSASLIPAVNKLGSMPIILSASEDVKQKVLPSIAAGDAMISYGLSEREAGSDAAAMKTRARLDGDSWVLNGTKAWITNSGISEWYTVMAVTDPEKGSGGISASVVHRDDPGFAGPCRRHPGVGLGQGVRLRRRHAGHHRRRPDLRRRPVHPGLPRRADDARRQDHPDLRGHQSGPAHGDRTESPEVGLRRTFWQVKAVRATTRRGSARPQGHAPTTSPCRRSTGRVQQSE
jgi:hypothetical protein